MQNAKDSFYATLRDRLAALDPLRTVIVHGTSRAAVLVAENEVATAALPLPEAFYIAWREVTDASGAERLELPLLKMSCEISYWTAGSEDFSAQDRGRALAALDGEFMAIANPPRCVLQDRSQTPPLALGANIYWTKPQFGAPTADGSKLQRVVTLEVFCPAEANQL